MRDKDIDFRKVERTAYCRGCDCELSPKYEDMAAVTYSSRNNGQWIYMCPNCICVMYKLMLEAGL